MASEAIYELTRSFSSKVANLRAEVGGLDALREAAVGTGQTPDLSQQIQSVEKAGTALIRAAELIHAQMRKELADT